MTDQLLDTPFKHPVSFTGLADNAWNRLSEAALSTGWKPVTKLAEAAVVAQVQLFFFYFQQGQLKVLTFSHIYTFPSHETTARIEDGGHKAELRVVNDVFWVRLCAMGDLGFAEAYMYGDVECDDLISLFQIFLNNRSHLSNLSSSLSYLFTLPQKLTSYRFLNTISNSRSNISAHYDISNDMFAGFLSKDMTYSCAIFEDLDGDLKGGEPGELKGRWNGGHGLKKLTNGTTNGVPLLSMPSPASKKTGLAELPSFSDPLEDAQYRKLHHIIRKARILPGHRVLEIAEGLGERVQVHLMDYRHMPEGWKGKFDRVVSVEMIEAVGKEFLEGFWAKVEWAMKEQESVGVVQVITIPEARFERYIKEIDFIRKWVLFPGGFLPTLTFLLQTLTSGSRGTLTVDSISNIGPHYARTLREWRKRFVQRFEEVVVPALQRDYPEVMGVAKGKEGRKEIEVFKRKWICDCYCEVGFTTRTLGDHIITFTREGAQSYGCDSFN
ncbi:S-adenosyl-L-methionine-dependent methyltransferase [Lentinula edodes]|uniref:S-adenosyl-L-methionine-dependent methyltransferase n=1 Tax=Lentinula edodes TaxID=5353 RepID=UPI001E8EC830|nr:S-adenosyl-L-methionine-dependent methyltransferase [Lentinula edodes]KAH7870932.1 S-adenosyl-L-methionine-dependent methyltransferase [Lentinula edodes]